MEIKAHVGTCPTCKQVTLPPEPPVGSIIRDNDGDAWVRNHHGWDCTDSEYEVYTWDQVLDLASPITVLYTPEEDA